ncbi:hypothetical protein QYM36_003263 [Artemia franciscana]|uniref:Nuclear respiratory factor 1 NLS/DNA-binding dimerisation domain-containing protein n=1 Tax=Artemia franciscana TaxID=6661 RepID=A0AA88I6Z2_ARTSF|nr:hypothetical protein QYM36_003263 [Artemia franciscana]KAK2723006.1 hypothetical protein QYM36_003263 [Artemia franciscana]
MASRSSGDNVMVSNLPLLFANGQPTSLNAMSLVDLQYFIPFLMKCATGQDPKYWETLQKPYWWPTDVPFSQEIIYPSLAISDINQVWTSRFRVLVNNCYIHYGCKYLLDFSAYLRDCDRKGVTYQRNNDGTISMFDRTEGKLLVKFRDVNRDYDLAYRQTPTMRIGTLPGMPTQLLTPSPFISPPLQRRIVTASIPPPGSVPEIRPVPHLQPSPQSRLVQPKPPAPMQGHKGNVPIRPVPGTSSSSLNAYEHIQILSNRPDLAIKPVTSKRTILPATTSSTSNAQWNTEQKKVPSYQVAPSQRSQPQKNIVEVSTQNPASSISREVTMALQKKLHNTTIRPANTQPAKSDPKQQVPQNVANLLKSLQLGNSVSIQLPNNKPKPAPVADAPIKPSLTVIPGPSVAPIGSSSPQATPTGSGQHVQKNNQTKNVTPVKNESPKTTPRKSLPRAKSRPSLLPKVQRPMAQNEDIVDIYLCDFCDKQFTSLQQTKVHEATCEAKSKVTATNRLSAITKPPEPEIVEISDDNPIDFLKYFGLVHGFKSDLGRSRKFLPKVIDEAPRKLFLVHQLRHMNIPLSCYMGRTFVSLSSKVLSANALRPQIEKYERFCSTARDDVTQTIRVSARDTSLLAQRLQSGVRRARDYQHEYCFSAKERRARYRYLKTGLTKRSRTLKRACKKPLLRIHKLTPSDVKDWKRYLVEDFKVVHQSLKMEIKKPCPLSKKLEIIKDVTPKYTKMTPRVPPIRIRAMPNGAMSITTASRPSKVKTVITNEPKLMPSVEQNGFKIQKARKSFKSSVSVSSLEEIEKVMNIKVQGVKRTAVFYAGRRRKKRRKRIFTNLSKTIQKPKKDVNANPSLIVSETEIPLPLDIKKLTREQKSLLRDECKELKSKGLRNLLLTEKGHVTRRMVQKSDSPSESPVNRYLRASPIPPISPLTLPSLAADAPLYNQVFSDPVPKAKQEVDKLEEKENLELSNTGDISNQTSVVEEKLSELLAELSPSSKLDSKDHAKLDFTSDNVLESAADVMPNLELETDINQEIGTISDPNNDCMPDLKDNSVTDLGVDPVHNLKDNSALDSKIEPCPYSTAKDRGDSISDLEESKESVLIASQESAPALRQMGRPDNEVLSKDTAETDSDLNLDEKLTETVEENQTSNTEAGVTSDVSKAITFDSKEAISFNSILGIDSPIATMASVSETSKIDSDKMDVDTHSETVVTASDTQDVDIQVETLPTPSDVVDVDKQAETLVTTKDKAYLGTQTETQVTPQDEADTDKQAENLVAATDKADFDAHAKALLGSNDKQSENLLIPDDPIDVHMQIETMPTGSNALDIDIKDENLATVNDTVDVDMLDPISCLYGPSPLPLPRVLSPESALLAPSPNDLQNEEMSPETAQAVQMLLEEMENDGEVEQHAIYMHNNYRVRTSEFSYHQEEANEMEGNVTEPDGDDNSEKRGSEADDSSFILNVSSSPIPGLENSFSPQNTLNSDESENLPKEYADSLEPLNEKSLEGDNVYCNTPESESSDNKTGKAAIDCENKIDLMINCDKDDEIFLSELVKADGERSHSSDSNGSCCVNYTKTSVKKVVKNGSPDSKTKTISAELPKIVQRVSSRQRKVYAPPEFIVQRLGSRKRGKSLELKRLQRDECKELRLKGLETLQGVRNGRVTRAKLKGPKD